MKSFYFLLFIIFLLKSEESENNFSVQLTPSTTLQVKGPLVRFLHSFKRHTASWREFLQNSSTWQNKNRLALFLLFMLEGKFKHGLTYLLFSELVTHDGSDTLIPFDFFTDLTLFFTAYQKFFNVSIELKPKERFLKQEQEL